MKILVRPREKRWKTHRDQWGKYITIKSGRKIHFEPGARSRKGAKTRYNIARNISKIRTIFRRRDNCSVNSDNIRVKYTCLFGILWERSSKCCSAPFCCVDYVLNGRTRENIVYILSNIYSSGCFVFQDCVYWVRSLGELIVRIVNSGK